MTACVFGGAPQHNQIRQLGYGPHCVVVTPGRVNDFLRRSVFRISQVNYLVLDEADRMLDMGFEPQIRELIQFLPKDSVRQTAMYTATWPREVRDIARTMTTTPRTYRSAARTIPPQMPTSR